MTDRARIPVGRITKHAADRAVERRLYGGNRNEQAVRAAIFKDVEAALNAKPRRRQNHKPKWAGLYHGARRPFVEGEWFVWREDERAGWIVREEQQAGKTVYAVITTLTRTGGQGA